MVKKKPTSLILDDQHYKEKYILEFHLFQEWISVGPNPCEKWKPYSMEDAADPPVPPRIVQDWTIQM